MEIKRFLEPDVRSKTVTGRGFLEPDAPRRMYVSMYVCMYVCMYVRASVPSLTNLKKMNNTFNAERFRKESDTTFWTII